MRDRSARSPASARRPRRRRCPSARRVGRRTRPRPPGARPGSAGARAGAGAVLPRPPLQRGAVARGGDRRRGRRRGVAATRSGSATTADRRRRRRAAPGPKARQVRRSGESCCCNASHGWELRAHACIVLTAGNMGLATIVRRRSMPPAHELTAPSPRVPALAVPRVAVRYRVALGVLALTALTFPRPLGPDLRSVGLDHLGPGDPAPRSVDRRRPVVEAAAGVADHAVRALRQPRARPVACSSPAPAPSPAW